jgi:hypothetical protein
VAGRPQRAKESARSFFRSTRFAWYFFAKIIFFALIYWSIFFARPDAFNFASGYNNNPLTTFVERFYVPDDKEEYFLNGAQDLTEGFRVRAAEVDKARRAYLRTEVAKEAEEELYQAALEVFHASIETQIEAYEIEHMDPLEVQKKELQARIDSLPFGASDKSELIGKSIELNEELLRHLTYITENRVFFATEENQKVFDAVTQARDEARNARNLAGAAYRELRGELFDHFSATRNQMIYQIGIVDFLYFSACISTTTTFGDVTANLPWVRMLVVVQIFAGIVILASFLDSLRKPTL